MHGSRMSYECVSRQVTDCSPRVLRTCMAHGWLAGWLRRSGCDAWGILASDTLFDCANAQEVSRKHGFIFHIIVAERLDVDTQRVRAL